MANRRMMAAPGTRGLFFYQIFFYIGPVYSLTAASSALCLLRSLPLYIRFRLQSFKVRIIDLKRKTGIPKPVLQYLSDFAYVIS
jgi:hypothetical protein